MPGPQFQAFEEAVLLGSELAKGEQLLGGHCGRCHTQILSNPHTHPPSWVLFRWGNEGSRCQITCPRFHNLEISESDVFMRFGLHDVMIIIPDVSKSERFTSAK